MASAPAGFTLHPRSWPAAGRAACSCLYSCPGTCWSTSETEWVLLGRAGLSQPCIQSGASPLPGFCMRGWEEAGRGLAGFHGSGERVGQEETGCLGTLGQVASPLQFWLRKGRPGAKARHRWTSEEVCMGRDPPVCISAPLPHYLEEQGGKHPHKSYHQPTSMPQFPGSPPVGFSAQEHP